jgi:hypothetical protein
MLEPGASSMLVESEKLSVRASSSETMRESEDASSTPSTSNSSASLLGKANTANAQAPATSVPIAQRQPARFPGRATGRAVACVSTCARSTACSNRARARASSCGSARRRF